MNKISFTVYDIFAYIAPGSIIIASIDYFFTDCMLLSTASQDTMVGIVGIFLLYVVGHINAAPSSFFLERLFAKKFLRDPRRVLLETVKTRDCRLRCLLFSEYFNPLPPTVQKKIISQVEKKNLKVEFDDKQKPKSENIFDVVFQLIYSAVKKDKDSLERLGIFLNLYGFARNISFAFFFIAAMLFINSHITGKWENNYWMLGFLGVGLIMLYRFLKFYRHYTYELYLSFLDVKDEKEKKVKKGNK